MTTKFDPTIQKLVDRAQREAARARAPGARAPGARAPAREKGRRYHRDPLNEEEADALFEWVYNTERFSPNSGKGNDGPPHYNPNLGRAVAEMLWRKWKAGKYDPEKAPKAFARVFELAAKDMRRDYPGRYGVATREHAARDLVRHWEGQVKRGEWP